LKNQCRELFKQELNTKEEAKTRDSTRRKRFKLTKTRWKNFHHVPTIKKQIISRSSVGGDQTSSAENVDRLDMLKESTGHNNMKKRRILLLNNLKRSSCLLCHVFQQATARQIPS
jgi:ribosomal protein S8E